MSDAAVEQVPAVQAPVFAASSLSQPGWIEFNRRKWGVTPHHEVLRADNKVLPSVEVVFYTNKRGKLVMPRLNPYLPIEFKPTATDTLHRLYRQWLITGEMLAKRWREIGVSGTIALHPGITDVRPFQWVGLRTGIHYTFQIPFPFDIVTADKDVGRRARNAESAGYTCGITSNLAQVIGCISETESRQEFGYRLTVEDLQLGLDLLGSDNFRIYMCYGPQMQPVSTLVVVHHPGCWSIGLAQGIVRDALSSGATQLMYRFALHDLEQAGALGYDFAGANLPQVSAFKLQWGGRLLPLYNVEQYGLRSTARYLFEWYKTVKSRGKSS